MTGIVDYNAGNIKSVEHALEAIKAPYVLSSRPSELAGVDRLIFPGVGDAAYAMEQLKKTGFDSFLKDFAASGKPMIGICLGSQIVFDYSEEGDVECLGLIPGKIRHFSSIYKDMNAIDKMPKVPNMGWHNLEVINGGSRFLEGVPENSDFYFVHSYVIQPENNEVVKAVADYGIKVPSIVEKDNLTVFQFHPEKSGQCGLQILKNFVEIG